MKHTFLNVGRTYLVPKAMLMILNNDGSGTGPRWVRAFPVAEHGQRIPCLVEGFSKGRGSIDDMHAVLHVHLILSDGRAVVAAPWLSSMLINDLDGSVIEFFYNRFNRTIVEDAP